MSGDTRGGSWHSVGASGETRALREASDAEYFRRFHSRFASAGGVPVAIGSARRTSSGAETVSVAVLAQPVDLTRTGEEVGDRMTIPSTSQVWAGGVRWCSIGGYGWRYVCGPLRRLSTPCARPEFLSSKRRKLTLTPPPVLVVDCLSARPRRGAASGGQRHDGRRQGGSARGAAGADAGRTHRAEDADGRGGGSAGGRGQGVALRRGRRGRHLHEYPDHPLRAEVLIPRTPFERVLEGQERLIEGAGPPPEVRAPRKA